MPCDGPAVVVPAVVVPAVAVPAVVTPCYDHRVNGARTSRDEASEPASRLLSDITDGVTFVNILRASK